MLCPSSHAFLAVGYYLPRSLSPCALNADNMSVTLSVSSFLAPLSHLIRWSISHEPWPYGG